MEKILVGMVIMIPVIILVSIQVEWYFIGGIIVAYGAFYKIQKYQVKQEKIEENKE